MTEIINQTMKKSPISNCLIDIYQKYDHLNEGEVASYIPELAKVNPNLFGVATCTTDGQIYQVGDCQHPFTIQSISKAFVYGLALVDHGIEKVKAKVGVEPTGEAFNSILFDEVHNRPYNPMVNAGAIAITSLIEGNSLQTRFNRILKLFSQFAGHPLELDEAVYKSESETGHRNRAIAYLELNSKMIEEPIAEHLDLYFRKCSILITARDLAIMSATLANNGINPLTKEQVIQPHIVRSILSVMTSCGMYNFSGEWLYEVGLPAKSGVGGGVMAVLPGQLGISVFSPRLDKLGNSVRGIQVCREFCDRFQLHIFDTHTVTESLVNRTYTGAVVFSNKERRQAEKEILEEKGKEILVYELKGDLYFATIEKLVRSLEDHLPGVKYIILDGHRLENINQCALNLLNEIQTWLESQEIILVMASFRDHVGEYLQNQPSLKCHFTVTLDQALEWCEDKLLAEYRHCAPENSSPLPLSEMDLLIDFTEAEIEIITPLFEELHCQPQEVIIREGDNASRLFLLALGNVTVSLKLSDTQERKRLKTYIPGVAFGELALFQAGKRSADVISDNQVICYVLSFNNLDKIIQTHTEIYLKLLRTLGKNLIKTIKQANEEIRCLSN